MIKPDISAIMIVYNGEKHISEAIQSVLNQTFTNFELIIVNDGSTDSTKEIIEKYKNEDNRIRLLNNEMNKGLSYSRNLAVMQANSDIIAVTDSDDINEWDRFEIQYNYLINNPFVDVLGCSVSVINETNEKIDNWDYPVSNDEIKLKLKNSCIVANPTVLFKKKVFTEINGYDKALTICEDWDFFVRASEKFNFFNLPDYKVKYRVHPKNISKNKLEHTITYSCYRSGYIDRSEAGLSISELIVKHPELRDKISEKIAQFYCYWINTYLKMGYKNSAEELEKKVINEYFHFYSKASKASFFKQLSKIYFSNKLLIKGLSFLFRYICI
ncbi:MAG: glycosyltransferase [Bacteroidia bacterium]